MNRRGFLMGTASVALTGTAVPVSADLETPPPVPPPGTGSVNELMRRCTGCNLCSARCPSHVLKAAGLEYGLGGVMMPRMDFTLGYCRPDCAECAKACPVGAIRLFKSFEKKHMRQAYAVYARDACLVAREDLACGNCAEHCPYKAISLVKAGDGRAYPKVDLAKCAGCGACEYHCPSKAIRVVGRTAEPDVMVPPDSVRDVPRLRSYCGTDYGFCNVGSNSGLYAFDWEGVGVKGVNLATSPQSLSQGFLLLDRFADRLAKGCVVVIPICPFSSVLPYYDDPVRQYKFYPFEKPGRALFWSSARARAVDRAIAQAEKAWKGIDPRLVAADRAVSQEEFCRSVEGLLECWRGEFEIKDFNAPLTPRNVRAFADTLPILREGLKMCVCRGWRPVIVLPPVSRYYDEVFKPVFWKTYVTDFVEAANAVKAPYWDYGRDGRFRDDAYFVNSLMLNRTGRRLFTAEVLRRIQTELSVPVSPR